MPLSEHEQRLLDQIERALYQDDPKFASTVRQTDLRTHMKRRLLKAGLVFVVGFGLLLGGVVAAEPLIGIAGFGVMVLALLLAMTSWKRMGQGAGPAPLQAVDPRSGGGGGGGGGGSRPIRPKGRPGGGGVLGRLEERWKRRWDERER